jgi:two-component system, OmpR family, sensor histidine kinase ChvG
MASNLFRGPRLGTKLLILMSLALVVIPWFSYQYLSEMEDFLVDSQANAQLLTAEGISNLLNGRTDLFDDLPLSPEGYEQLFAHPLANPIRIDGKDNDWEDVLEYKVGFGGFNPQDANADTVNQFYLVLGEHNAQIFTMLHVNDDHLVFRDRNILRLDMSDHVRIEFTGPDGTIKRYVITTTDPGVTTAYPMSDWRYAIGQAENRIQGHLTPNEAGYSVEFRVPLEMLGDTPTFGLVVVDVDDAQTRVMESKTSTLPSGGREAFGLVLLKSPEVLKIVEGLGYSAANIQVIDRQGRIRADVGGQTNPESNEQDKPDTTLFSAISLFMDTIYTIVDDRLRADTDESDSVVISNALAGTPNYQRRYTAAEGEIIIAAHPIIAEEEIIGTVVLKQNTDRILELRRDGLKRIVNFSVLSIFTFVALILLFSVHLARRIRKLGGEATNAIDIYGRLQTNRLISETESGDEIGDLARSFSGMLARLHQHTQFLENMPRTLRHEINNPLNALSTSLQNLEGEASEVAREKYLDSAKRAVMRIGIIVQNLADAASLEDALEAEEFEVIDLHGLVSNYLGNCNAAHPDRRFEYRGTSEPVLSEVSDSRIEQLLDKLVDNAVDFSDPGSLITVGITTDNQHLTIFVTNEGSTIPADKLDSIFDSMVSIRETETRLHFGMGLYVVRVIAAHHGGTVSAANLLNGNGVTIRVRLPLHTPVRENAAAA